MPNKEEKITWGLRKRLQFIEFQLLFKREIKSSILIEEFGTSRQQSSTDINLYKDLHPDNLLPYSPKDKSYKPSRSFIPYYISENLTDDIEETYNQIAESTSIETIPTLKRTQIKDLLARIMLAIECDDNLELIYKSANSPYGQKRKIKPLALAYVGNRPHLRAYCFNKSEHRDFVLSRFSTMPKLIKTTKNTMAPVDKLWSEKINIKLIANPKLDNDGQSLIKSEYDLMNIPPVEIRKALIHYYLLHNNLPCCSADIKIANDSPWIFPLLISNWHECQDYLFSK